MKIREIIHYMESVAPTAYQESYDNSGLLTGSPNEDITGILLTLDCIESVVEEAIDKQCNLIIAHHPIIFGGLKRLTGKNYVERTVIKAIKNDIGIYAIHTNLDNISNGVNAKIAEKIGLQHTQVLLPKRNQLKKLTTFVPISDAEKVLEALSEAGAGNIGNYANCSFTLIGEGTFRPNEQANPHIGKIGKLEKVQEMRIEVILPAHLERQVIQAMKKAHPYEEVAYYVNLLENENQEVGSGMIGNLAEPMEEKVFLQYLKDKMQVNCIRHTQLLNKKVKKVAVCGGAGGFLLRNAIGLGADIFITADYKYHEFFDADKQIIIADIGHYESEQFTKELLLELLTQKFPHLPIHISHVNTNPVHYF
ncbi:MAG: Nif3-like dinuclear metal center hexameric protein [Thermoflexibacter sp.]|jgi:dinuclear metal center YbgI/SA1388 family protein|nr:Nif3-like dinuclear metal center hexameric protein [Thermoflexibacter sp.]